MEKTKKFEPKFLIKNKSINEQYIEIINNIEYYPLQEFIDNILYENKVSSNKIKNAINVAKLSKFILENEKMTNKHAKTSIELVLVAASLIHNVYYSYGSNEISKLFLFREKYYKNLNPEVQQFFDMICQAIEGQLGKDNIIPQMIPISGNPTYYFALACSLYYKNQLGRDIIW